MDYEQMIEMDLPVAAAIVGGDSKRKIKNVNAEFIRLFGYTEKIMEGMEHHDLIYKKDAQRFEKMLDDTQQGKHVGSQEIRIITEEHEVRWVDVRCTGMYDKDLLLVFWDIDKQMTGVIEQQKLTRKYELMEDLSREYPFDYDIENNLLLRSHRFMEMNGDYEAKDVYYPFEEEITHIHPADRTAFLNAMKEASASAQSGSVDGRLNLKDDNSLPKYIWFRVYYKSVKDENGKITRIVGKCFNIDTDRTLQEEVRRDPLTRLLNKMEVQQEITAYLDRHREGCHALFLIDIDNFKGVNDNFGHTFGDTVIMDFANQIRLQFRQNDIVGRVGGDEFLVFMKNVTPEKAKEKAKILCESLSKEYVGSDIQYKVSSSIGLAICTEEENNFSSLFEKADHAMYRAKMDGKCNFKVANPSDVGPLLLQTRTIESRGKIRTEDKEFLGFAVSLMAHAKNLDGSLNMLLKRIAERYDLDFVLLLENSVGNKSATMTNSYAKRYDFFEKITFKHSEKFFNELTPGDYRIITLDAIRDLKKFQTIVKNVLHIRAVEPFSAVVGKFEFFGNQTGEVVYVSSQKNRIWTKNEIEFLLELTRIMSIFVSLRSRMDASEAMLRRVKTNDQLTGLYKQEEFRHVVTKILKNANPDKVYAMEYLDINHFGYINDNYGYKAGDTILKNFADSLVEQDWFCAGCRLYSDLFLVLVIGDSEEELAENLRKFSQKFMNMQNYKFPNSSLSITGGVYFIESVMMDVEIAIENATLTWKYAKNTSNRDISFFNTELRVKRIEEQKIIGEFFEALYRDDFQMYLQPKFLLGKRTVYGAEALARWKRPDGTILSPFCFIDFLEKIGYITELDFYIYEEVLKTLDKWRKQKRRQIVISTNFSGRHFDADGTNFIRRIRQILSKYSVSPQYVEIEVTEGVMVKNVRVLEKCMNELHEMGFRVAIDDFGTGYSSLSALADMPADVVKIDKSFIDKEMSDRNRSMLSEIGQMLRILEKDVIIEGVETPEQESYLQNEGFTCGQGYLCNKPIPIGEFEKMYL